MTGAARHRIGPARTSGFHASIVARELGLPAVVGTPNATMRPRDGDRIRVDAERGTVEPLA